RQARGLEPRRDAIERSHVEDRPGDDELGASLELVLEPPYLAIEIVGSRIHGDAYMKGGWYANRLAANVNAAIETRHRVEEPNPIHTDDRGGVGIVRDERHVAGHDEDVTNAHRVGAEQ